MIPLAEVLSSTLDGVRDDNGRLMQLLDRYEQAALSLFSCDEIHETMREVARLSLVAEAISDVAKAVRDKARVQLQAVMAEMGAEAIDIGSHRVSLAKGAEYVDIYAPEEVPTQLKVQPPTPPPEPDVFAIKSLLRAGEDVPGARLAHRRPTVRFQAKG